MIQYASHGLATKELAILDLGPRSYFVTKIILWMIPLLILVDSINGVTVRIGFSVSQPVKVLFLLLLCTIAIRTRKGRWVLLVNLAFDLLFIFYHGLVLMKDETVVSDLQWLLRFNILWIGAFVFTSLAASGHLTEARAHKIFIFVTLVLAANLVAGTLGYGYSQYTGGVGEKGIGAKGFIYAGNEMSYLMLVCQIMVLGWYYKKNQLFKYSLWAILFLGMAVLKVTKTAMLGSILVTLSYPFLGTIINFTVSKRRIGRKIMILLFIVALLLIALPYLYEIIESTGVFLRINYFIAQRGFVGAMLSSRDEFAAIMWEDFSQNYGIGEIFFGSGEFKQLVEIDLLDLLSVFGIFGVIVCYGYVIVKGIQAGLKMFTHESSWAMSVFLLAGFSILISLIAGHVFYSGLATPYMGLAFAYLSLHENEKDHLKYNRTI